MAHEWRCSACNQWGGRHPEAPDPGKRVDTAPPCPGCQKPIGALEMKGSLAWCYSCKIQLTPEEVAAARAKRTPKCACGGTWEWTEKGGKHSARVAPGTAE